MVFWQAEPRYRKQSLIDAIKAVHPNISLLCDELSCKAYSARAMADAAPTALAVVMVETTADVQSVLQICHRYNVQVLPRGAGTNLSCSVSPTTNTVIICTSRMRTITDFDPLAGTISVQAGVRNQAVSDYVKPHGWYYAPDPSSRRNCTIGGNVATNSGGASCLRSGVTVNNIAGLTMVLFNGDIIELGNESYDAPGLDFASVLCGSEGQMGIVTEVVLRLCAVQPSRIGMLLEFDDRATALTAGAAILASGVAPVQMDYMDAYTVELCESVASVAYPRTAGGIVLIDLVGANDVLLSVSETIGGIADEHESNCTIATTTEEADRMWRGRERIYAAAARISRYIATDVAVPLSRLNDMFDAVDRCAEEFGHRHATAAHLGDGTVHSFVFYNDQCAQSLTSVEACATAIRKAAIQLGGTCTSEYGVGTRYRHLLAEQFSDTDLRVQQRCIEALQGENRSSSEAAA